MERCALPCWDSGQPVVDVGQAQGELLDLAVQQGDLPVEAEPRGLLAVAQVRLGEGVRTGLGGLRCGGGERDDQHGRVRGDLDRHVAGQLGGRHGGAQQLRRPGRDRAGVDQLGLGVEVDGALGPATDRIGVLVHGLDEDRGRGLVDLRHRPGDRDGRAETDGGHQQQDPPVAAEHAQVVRKIGGHRASRFHRFGGPFAGEWRRWRGLGRFAPVG